MAGYARKIESTISFDGQQVAVTLKPLGYGDLLRLQKDREVEVLQEYQALLPEYLTFMSPILDSVGEPVTLDEIRSAAYFAPLVGLILRAHLDAAVAVAQRPRSADQSEG